MEVHQDFWHKTVVLYEVCEASVSVGFSARNIEREQKYFLLTPTFVQPKIRGELFLPTESPTTEKLATVACVAGGFLGERAREREFREIP